jgi:hypothetical protein
VRFSDAEWHAVWTPARRDKLAVAAWIAVAALDRAQESTAKHSDAAVLRSMLGQLNLARTQQAKAGALLNQAVAALHSDAHETQRLAATATYVAGGVRRVDEHVEALMRILPCSSRQDRSCAGPGRTASSPIAPSWTTAD